MRNLSLWNPVIQFYIRRLLILSFNIFIDTCIDPLRDLTVKSKSYYNFRKSTNIETLDEELR